MKEAYRTVYQGGEAEITEKKSRFIATVRAVHSEEEAAAFVAEMKKKYWNARHNCFAFAAGEGQDEVLRFSDDGEPQGTAGKPILDVITGQKLHNTAVVVTRYFGGILLGTGGLVRAYQAAARAGIEASTVMERKCGLRMEITTDYNGYGRLQYLMGEQGIHILDSLFTDKVKMEILVPEGQEQDLIKAVMDGTSGKAEIEEGEKCTYADTGEELIFL